MAKEKKSKVKLINPFSDYYQEKRQATNSWITEKSSGNEKKIGAVILLIAFIIFGVQSYYYMHPTGEKETVGDILDRVTVPNDLREVQTMKQTLTIDGQPYSYSSMERDQKGIDLIEQLKFEIQQPVLDTLRIINIQQELEKLNIKL